MRAWLLAAWVVLGLAGCQCFVPVEEGGPKDAGPGGGTGSTAGGGSAGGGSAGGGGAFIGDGGCSSAGGGSSAGDPILGCVTPNDCRGMLPPLIPGCGFTGGPAGFGCIDGQCVPQCVGGRICVSMASSCLGCMAPPNTGGCPTAACPVKGSIIEVTVEQIRCHSGTAPFVPGEKLQLVGTGDAANGCPRILRKTTGTCRDYGRVLELTSGDLVAYWPELGGTCIGTSLPTGAIRSLFECSRCQVQLSGY